NRQPGRRRKAVSSGGGNPTVREGAKKGSSRQTAVSSKSALKTRRSKLRRHRRHSRSLRRNHPAMALAAAPAFVYNLERKDRTIYFAGALNGPTENFFGEVLVNDPPPLTLTVHHVAATSTLSAP